MSKAGPMDERMFHLTLGCNLPAILRDGLVGGRKPLFSGTRTPAEVQRIYGAIPVFLAQSPWMEERNYDLLLEYGQPADFALLEVDVTGLPLVADIMGLIDQGAHLAEDHLWFEEHDTPLARFEVADAIAFDVLTRPGPAAAAAIAWSGTAACLVPIAPVRIQVALPGGA